MPMLAVQLKPGVDTQQTPTLNSAGIYQSQLIRYKDGLVQSYGGCQPFIGTSIPSTVRSLHAWLDSDNESWLSAAATNNLIVMHAGNIYDITPQTRLSSFAHHPVTNTTLQLPTPIAECLSMIRCILIRRYR